jgi:hypothetical protein
MISLLAFISSRTAVLKGNAGREDVRSEALAAEILSTVRIKEYVFACQAIHISVAEERKEANGGTRLGEKQLVEDEVELELVENELCHQEAVLPYAKKENARLKGLRDTLEGRDAE